MGVQRLQQRHVCHFPLKAFLRKHVSGDELERHVRSTTLCVCCNKDRAVSPARLVRGLTLCVCVAAHSCRYLVVLSEGGAAALVLRLTQPAVLIYAGAQISVGCRLLMPRATSALRRSSWMQHQIGQAYRCSVLMLISSA